jgi:hypothetical protein
MQDQPAASARGPLLAALEQAGACDRRVACARRLGCSWLAMHIAARVGGAADDERMHAA